MLISDVSLITTEEQQQTGSFWNNLVGGIKENLHTKKKAADQ